MNSSNTDQNPTNTPITPAERLVTFTLILLAGTAFFAPNACRRADDAQGNQLVVYTALDRQFSEPILADFTRQTGINVQAVYDTESTKTVGLVNRIRAEARRPRCDVFWNNEILNTLRLKHEGLLQPAQPTQADNFPPQFRDADNTWFGLAARARVLIVNIERVGPEQTPESIHDLADPAWRGQVGIAKPLFGTTASHAAALFAHLGPEEAKDWFEAIKANDIRVVAGNKTCAELVGRGELAFGLTDTDDAIIEIEAGRPVQIVFPDNAPDAVGTLVLPNTLAIIKGTKNAPQAEQLINYLLSPEVEAHLARGPSAQIPLNSKTATTSRVVKLSDLHPMPVDFEAAARAFPEAAAYVEQNFLE